MMLGGYATPPVDLYGFAVTIAVALLGPSTSATNRNVWLKQLPASLAAALGTDLDSDPSKRTVSPLQLIDVMAAASTSPVAVDPPTARAVPTEPTYEQLATPGLFRPRHATASTATSAVASAYDALPDPHRDLRIAAEQTFGPVDLRAVTVDRLDLRLHTESVAEPDGENLRSLWRRPAMIASIVVALALIITAIVLLTA
jgi:hypothetical protein